MAQVIQIQTSKGPVNFLFEEGSYCNPLTEDDQNKLKSIYVFDYINEDSGFVLIGLEDGFYGLPEYRYDVIRDATQEEINERNLKLQREAEEKAERQKQWEEERKNLPPPPPPDPNAWYMKGKYHRGDDAPVFEKTWPKPEPQPVNLPDKDYNKE